MAQDSKTPRGGHRGIDPSDIAESDLVTTRGTFRMVAFRADGEEHLALVYGRARGRDGVLVRMHSECLSGDVFGALRCECGSQLDLALNAIVREGSGVLVYLRGHEGRGIGLVDKVRTNLLQDERGLDTVDSATALGLPVDVRDYGPAARVLAYLGIGSVRLLSNNPHKIRSLESHGIRVAARVPLLAAPNDENLAYLTAKRDRLGHDLPQVPMVPAPRERAEPEGAAVVDDAAATAPSPLSGTPLTP
ncbi:GTP cyclohydrolase II [Streptomonospora nanhaiensis]|uniref:GTP cyclohydrolase II n=1 Tax=Streptomonospora nanhaiensis TaxID=1323731 RepID=UPI001C38EDF5|nr:GTP cyclohydrolase II [Streptomonospora nanhaiensis]MBV2363416.1 GTP cyclohydrolase II [Streptomonospora nanhaiensis]MBX9389649.1 GTP cyclohydrolase II [Streptomonospora nanhaiensis]